MPQKSAADTNLLGESIPNQQASTKANNTPSFFGVCGSSRKQSYQHDISHPVAFLEPYKTCQTTKHHQPEWGLGITPRCQQRHHWHRKKNRGCHHPGHLTVFFFRIIKNSIQALRSIKTGPQPLLHCFSHPPAHHPENAQTDGHSNG